MQNSNRAFAVVQDWASSQLLKPNEQFQLPSNALLNRLYVLTRNLGLCGEAGKCVLLPQRNRWPDRLFLWLRNSLDPALLDPASWVRWWHYSLERYQHDLPQQIWSLHQRLLPGRSQHHHRPLYSRKMLPRSPVELTPSFSLFEHLHGCDNPSSGIREMEH